MMRAVHTTVDPGTCVPITRVRKILKGGIVRPKSSFRTATFFAGPGSAEIIILTGSADGEVTRNFHFTGGERKNLRDKIESKEKWFAIVDGEHTWMAITELWIEDPNVWAGFQ